MMQLICKVQTAIHFKIEIIVVEYNDNDNDNDDYMYIDVYLVKKTERKTFLHTLLEYLPLFFLC